jgi:hypothetical protein
MSEGNLGEVGRIREGRVDTGTQLYNNEPLVSAELIRRALTNASFGLDDAHWHTQKKDGRATKFVTSLAFSATDAPIAEFDRQTTEAFRELAATAWFCHVWLNPNGLLTINFVGVQKEAAQQLLTVRDRAIKLVPVNGVANKDPGVSLDGIKTILVKFFFTNPKRIPRGIRRVERPNDETMDKRHAAEVSK